MVYVPSDKRYDKMLYRRTGRSGLKLPAISLGLWQNFGHISRADVARDMCRSAFDLGITHFDLANNYGPPPGSAEEMFGAILKTDFRDYRDELIISTKAGYRMWPGPYGEWGSRKYLLSSLDQSLKRMGLDYVDIFYSHRFDPETPLEETMGALDAAVRQGKALYVGISSYSSERTHEAAAILKRLGTPAIIHQPSYSILNRWTEEDQPARRAGGGRHGLHRLLAALAGPADRQVSEGRSGRQPCGRRRAVVAEHVPQQGKSHLRPRARSAGQEARPDAGADGARLGAARRAHDLGADRRQPCRADRGCRRGTRQARASARPNWTKSTGAPATPASISGSDQAPPEATWQTTRHQGTAQPALVSGRRTSAPSAIAPAPCSMGYAYEDFMGKPVVAIINTWSDINPCHTHLRQRAEEVKRGVWQAGGFPVELPALSLAENFVKPTTMLYRNLLALETEELLRSHPVDGVVLLGGCDKTTPALLMGAISMNLPAIFMPAGAMLRGNYAGKVLGSGSDVWKYWADKQAGKHLRGRMARRWRRASPAPSAPACRWARPRP